MTWDTAGYWLAHAAVGGTAVLLAASLALLVSRQPVRRLRVVELALAGCLVVPWLGRLSLWPQWSAGLLGDPTLDRIAEAIPGEGTAAVGEASPRTDPLPSPLVRPVAAERPLTPPQEVPAVAPVVPAAVEAAGLSRFAWPRLPVVLVAAYALGALLVGLRWLAAVVQLVRLCRGARPVPAEVAVLFEEIAGPAGKQVRLRLSERVRLPLTFGWLRPVILLPAELCRGGDGTGLRWALAHEWSHVERGDLLRWYLAGLVQVLFFWQPLFWWLRREQRLAQDYLADALAAGQAEAVDYAAYLVELARRSLGMPVAAALGVGDRRSNLYRRVLMLLNTHQPLPRRCGRAWTVAVLAVAVALLGAVSAVRLDAAPPKEEKTAPQKEKPKELQPAKGESFTYTGQVVNKDTGKPIAGAVVTVRRSLYGDPEVKAEDWVIEETKHPTNAEGKFTFTIPPDQAAQRYLYIELDVEAKGYAPQKGFGYAFSMIRKNETMGGRPFFEHVTLRAGQEIHGMIETPEGKPAAGVKVLAYSVTTNRSREVFEYGSFADTKTDDRGRFALTLVTPGDAVFWILPKKYVPTTHALKKGQRGDVGRFVLQDGIVLKGKVVDTQGKPVAGVFVNAESEERNEALDNLNVADSIRRGAVTNDQGEFELAPLPPGRYRLQPDEHNQEPTQESRRLTRRPLPAVFVAKKITLREGDKPGPIEVRAVPHVVIEAQYLDSKGKPRRGHECFVSGQMDGTWWHIQARPDKDGKFSIKMPHGLERAQMHLMTNEHGSLRYRKGKGEPLQRGHYLMLETLDRDIKGIEIIRYDAPILLVKVSTKDGAKPKEVIVTAVYPPHDGPGVRFTSKNGKPSDVHFEQQEDGRYRSSQLLPDEEVTVTVDAEGYAEKSEMLKVPEGQTKEIEIILEKK